MDTEGDANQTAWDPAVNDSAVNGSAPYEAYDDGQELEYLCGVSFGSVNSACFLAIFILSVAGNGLLLCALVRHEDLKRVTNAFVVHLACSDLVFALTLPFWAVYHHSHWVFGDFACKFLTAAYFVGIYSSVILLTAMTLDRFAAVVVRTWPRARSRSRRRWAAGACAAAWLVGIGASLSDALDSRVEDQEDGTFTCEASSSSSDSDPVGQYLQLSLLFILPFAIIVVCYSAILRRVLRSPFRRKHRTVVVVLCNVVAFFGCWAPHNALAFLSSVYRPEGCPARERLDLAVEVCRLLAYAHCCVNPVLYALSLKFRRHLVSLCRCVRVQRGAEGGEPERSLGQSTDGCRGGAARVELQPVRE